MLLLAPVLEVVQVRPSVWRSSVLPWNRRYTSPTNGTARSSPPGAGSRYVPSADGSGKGPADTDQIDATVFVLADAKLLTDGAQHSVNAGNQRSQTLVVGAAPDFSLVRNGTVVLHGVGADAIVANPPYYDSWSSTGFFEH